MGNYIRGAKGRFKGSHGGGSVSMSGGRHLTMAKGGRTVSATYAGSRGRRGRKPTFIRENPSGKRPARIPYQRGLTRRGRVVVNKGRTNKVTHVKAYVQKARIPKAISPNPRATRGRRTVYIYSQRGRTSRKSITA